MKHIKQHGWKVVAGIFIISGLLGVADLFGCTPCGDLLTSAKAALLAPTNVVQ